MHSDVGWRDDPEAYLIALELKNDDLDVIANAGGFAKAADEDEQGEFSVTD